MKPNLLQSIKYLILPLFLFSVLNGSQDNRALINEIKILENKIEKTKNEIRETNNKTLEDEKSYLAYTKREASILNRYHGDIDSIKYDYQKLSKSADSILTMIRNIKTRQKEFELKKKELRKYILSICSKLKDEILLLPDGNIRNNINVLNFLAGELKTSSIDNVEGLERLWQIFLVLSESSGNAETYTADSPIQKLPGRFNYIRLGHFYLACVNETGTKGAIWTQNNNEGKWKIIESPPLLGELKKCVDIKQGTLVPQIVNIPFKHTIKRSTESNTGDEK